MIKKDSPTSVRKHTTEWKAHEKTMRTAFNPDLNPDLNPWLCDMSILENKTNATSHPNIGSLKTAIDQRME